MSVLLILLIASVALGAVFLGAFIWATRHGQFDDMTTPAMRILSEEDMDDNQSAKEEGNTK